MVYNKFRPKKAHTFCASSFLFHHRKDLVINMDMVENNVRISGALREYLEAIYEISQEKSNVRTTDIALRLGISKPSVNRAVTTLKAKGLVTHEPYGAVVLTDKGRALGEYSGNKNKMIKRFLVTVLNLSDDEAEKEACSIGKTMSYGTVEKMKSYMEA